KDSGSPSWFIFWQVHDPKRLRQPVFDRAGAESRLSSILFAELGAAFGGAPFSAFVATAPGDYRAEAILDGVTRQYRELALRDYGIEVVDVGLRRLDFPRSEEHTSELQSRVDLVCRLLLENKNDIADERFVVYGFCCVD